MTNTSPTTSTLIANYELQLHTFHTFDNFQKGEKETEEAASIEFHQQQNDIQLTIEEEEAISKSRTREAIPILNDDNNLAVQQYNTKVIQVKMKSAISTKGRHLIIKSREDKEEQEVIIDSTGLLIWPASYLLCQLLSFYITSNTDKKAKLIGSRILELGCGCGIAGITTALAYSYKQQQQIEDNDIIIVSTDMDSKVVELCQQNIELNNIYPNNGTKIQMIAKQLKWGDESTLNKIMDETIRQEDTNIVFDTIIGADIIYPDTTLLAISNLLSTVQHALRNDGNFLLSFVVRDYKFETVQKLVQAANKANFMIDSIESEACDFIPKRWSTKYLPPVLDATLLSFTRATNAVVAMHNNSLGDTNCKIFPGLKDFLQKQNATEESSVEEWDAPPYFSSSDGE